jgi:8-oxo-dGTP pyrophosphatase MutT (NUDIX family)
MAVKNVAVVALMHPEKSDLFLHGLRRDNNSWCIPAGSIEQGEHPFDGAQRELFEETGLKQPIKFLGLDKHPERHIYLFTGKYGGQPVTAENDPDAEFKEFKFLDPRDTSIKWHVPRERNILLKYLFAL